MRVKRRKRECESESENESESKTGRPGCQGCVWLVVTWTWDDEDARCENWGINWSGGAKIGDGLALLAGGQRDWHV